MSLGPVMVDLAGIALEPDERELLAHPQVGSVILFSRNYESPAQLSRLAADIHAVRSPPLLVAVDQEGGRVQRFREGFTRLPPLREIGRRYAADAAAGLALARELGWLMAAELRACGVDMSFAPCVDIDYGLSHVIGDRALHGDARAVAELAVAYMLGMRDAGMAATAKHFPGHGAVAADSHVALPIDRREWPDIEADFGPYRRLIANGLPAVMVAHVVFPAVDERPASLSRRWIDGVLRGDLGFQGAVFADDLSMAGAAAFGDILSRAALAREAGCDVLPVCNDRAATLRLLEGLRAPPDPVSRMRLVRLHGREPESPSLAASPRWQSAVAASRELVERPALRLEGEPRPG
jgi:beta-N-acetylhexosaminidase